VVRFAKGVRELEALRPHPERLARAGRVAAIGVARELIRLLHSGSGICRKSSRTP
jgi:hypothetical protein